MGLDLKEFRKWGFRTSKRFALDLVLFSYRLFFYQ